MRIVLIGQAAFGEKVLQTLVERGEEIVGVGTTSGISGKVNPLEQLACKLGILTFASAKMREPEVYNEYTNLNPDLNIMAYVTSIIPESVLNYPGLGTIQYHPSLLPKHRGGSAINWAIINGETRTGVTIFWPDSGIDTSPILLQREVEISPDDTVGSLYFNKLFPLGIEALIESIELIKRGVAPRVPQDETQASYEELCTEKDGIINWLQPVLEIYNLIRGTNPQPGAITNFGTQRFKVFDSELLAGVTGGMPGEIIETSGQGPLVAATGGAIRIRRVRMEGSPKVSAIDFAGQAGLKVGDRLGS